MIAKSFNAHQYYYTVCSFAKLIKLIVYKLKTYTKDLKPHKVQGHKDTLVQPLISFLITTLHISCHRILCKFTQIGQGLPVVFKCIENWLGTMLDCYRPYQCKIIRFDKKYQGVMFMTIQCLSQQNQFSLKKKLNKTSFHSN